MNRDTHACVCVCACMHMSMHVNSTYLGSDRNPFNHIPMKCSDIIPCKSTTYIPLVVS